LHGELAIASQTLSCGRVRTHRYQPHDDVDRDKLFATFYFRDFDRKGNVLELRRDGGLEFEYGAILELIVILWLTNKKLS
jgi:hypothetical protein